MASPTPSQSRSEHHYNPTTRQCDQAISPVKTVCEQCDERAKEDDTAGDDDDEAPMPTLTGDPTGDPSTSAVAIQQRSPLGLAAWFSSPSLPASAGQDGTCPSPSATSISASGRLQKPPPSSPKPAGKSRFAFFSSGKATPPPPPRSPDELLTLDVARSLAHDASSPSSSKDLHATALSLLSRYQAAYRTQDAEMRGLRREEEARREEAEEAEVRNRHLRAQLEEMSRRVEEQEGTLRSLLEELVAERRAREERERESEESADLVMPAAAHRSSKSSEDLHVERDARRRRKCAGPLSRSRSRSRVSESDGESVFSRCISPESQLDAQAAAGVRRARREGEARGDRDRDGDGVVVLYACGNCEGRDASAAWGAVRGLRGENAALRGRVAGLEGAVEEVLGLVGEGGLWR